MTSPVVQDDKLPHPVEMDPTWEVLVNTAFEEGHLELGLETLSDLITRKYYPSDSHILVLVYLALLVPSSLPPPSSDNASSSSSKPSSSILPPKLDGSLSSTKTSPLHVFPPPHLPALALALLRQISQLFPSQPYSFALLPPPAPSNVHSVQEGAPSRFTSRDSTPNSSTADPNPKRKPQPRTQNLTTTTTDPSSSFQNLYSPPLLSSLPSHAPSRSQLHDLGDVSPIERAAGRISRWKDLWEGYSLIKRESGGASADRGMGEDGWWRVLDWAVEVWERDLRGVVKACQADLDDRKGKEKDLLPSHPLPMFIHQIPLSSTSSLYDHNSLGALLPSRSDLSRPLHVVFKGAYGNAIQHAADAVASGSAAATRRKRRKLTDEREVHGEVDVEGEGLDWPVAEGGEKKEAEWERRREVAGRVMGLILALTATLPHPAAPSAISPNPSSSSIVTFGSTRSSKPQPRTTQSSMVSTTAASRRPLLPTPLISLPHSLRHILPHLLSLPAYALPTFFDHITNPSSPFQFSSPPEDDDGDDSHLTRAVLRGEILLLLALLDSLREEEDQEGDDADDDGTKNGGGKSGLGGATSSGGVPPPLTEMLNRWAGEVDRRREKQEGGGSLREAVAKVLVLERYLRYNPTQMLKSSSSTAGAASGVSREVVVRALGVDGRSGKGCGWVKNVGQALGAVLEMGGVAGSD